MLMYEKNFCLTHPQKRILNIEKLYPSSSINNIGGIVQIHGLLDLKKLKTAIQYCIETTEALRVKITQHNSEITQHITDVSYEVPIFNVSESEMLALTNKDFQKSMNLMDSSLFKFWIFNIDNKKCAYYIKCHHIISDGWSMQIIVNKIKKYYELLINDEVLEDSKDDYSLLLEKEKRYLKSFRKDRDEKFWANTLEDMDKSYFFQKSDDIHGERKSFYIDEDLTQEIYDYLKKTKYSIQSFFNLCLFSYLQKFYQKEDFIIGTPVLNRTGIYEKNTSGMSVSTMPYRMSLDTEKSLSCLLEETQKNYKKFYLHQRYPFDLLTENLKSSQKIHGQILQIFLNSYSTNMVDNMGGEKIDYKELYPGCQTYGLQMCIKEWGGELEIQYDYQSSLYNSENIEDINKRLNIFIRRLLSNPESKLKDISLLTEKEKSDEIHYWNSKKKFQKESIIDIFHENSKKHPDRIAVEDGPYKMTYYDLDCYSNQIANYLKKCRLKKGDFVAILMEHSPKMIALLLGALKSGIAYVPIDPSAPKKRIEYILRDSCAKIIFKDQGKSTKEQKNINIIWDEILNFENSFENISCNDDTAYMIYTSGSTGQPKGVMVTHENINNYILCAKENFTNTSDDNFALYSSLAFDLTVTSLYTPLVVGSTIFIYRQKDYTEFVLNIVLNNSQIKVLKVTPAHLSLIDDNMISKTKLEKLIVGGEQFSTVLAKKITDKSNDKIKIFNEYGPTEATVGCMIHKYNKNHDVNDSVPIGLPISNTSVYLLDENKQLVIPGTMGEIYIAGKNVSKGYWNNEDINKNCFIDNLFIKDEKVYKSGDIARRMKNGDLEYIGRKDQQVKIKGHRIEIEEVEMSIMKLENVNKAYVLESFNKQKQRELIAYVEMSNEMVNIKKDAELKRELAEIIPVFMIPSQIIILDKIPLSLNGKVDKEKLPNPSKFEMVNKELSDEEKLIEEEIIKCAKEVLNYNDISPLDNFYHLGGDSIKAMSLISKLRKKEIYLHTKNIFTHPVFREMVTIVNKSPKTNVKQEIAQGYIDSPPIIHWFWEQEFQQENHFHQSIAIKLNKKYSKEKIKEVMNILISYHDALRLRVDSQNRRLYFAEYSYVNNIHNYNMGDEYNDETIEKTLKNISLILKKETNIYEGPLFNYAICQGAETYLILVAHHFLIDSVSWQILLEDLIVLINSDNPSEKLLPAKTMSYKKFGEHIHEYALSEEISLEVNYWENKLQNIDEEYTKRITNGYTDDKSTLSRLLSLKSTKSLINVSHNSYRAQVNELLVTAITRAFCITTNKSELTIEMEGHGREEIGNVSDYSRTIGWFTSLYVNNFKYIEDISENIRTVKESHRNVPNNGVGFGILKYIYPPGRFLNNLKVFPKLRFNYLGEVDNVLKKYPGYSIKYFNEEPIDKNRNQLTIPLELVAYINNGRIGFDLSFSREEFSKRLIDQLLREIENQIENILQHSKNDDSVKFTTSDFETINMSNEELDSLFK